MALMAASVPELVMRTFLMLGKQAVTNWARRTSRAVGMPKVMPFAQVLHTASSTAGYAWPRISGPQDMT